MRRRRDDEDFEGNLRRLLSDEAVEATKFLSPEKLRAGDAGEEEKFERIVKLAERLAREIDEEIVSAREKLFEEGGSERAGAFLLVFGRLVNKLMDAGLYDHAIKLNVKIPWWNDYEFHNPRATPEAEDAHRYTRRLNWIRMVRLSRRAAEAAERNIELLDEFDRAVIAQILSSEDEETAGKIYPNIDEAREKERYLTDLMCWVFEPDEILRIREELPGRAKPKPRTG